MKYFSKPSKPKTAPNAQVYDFAKIELPPDAVDKELFKDSPSSTLESFYESPGEWVAKRRASRRLSLEVTKEQPQQELSRSSSAPFTGPYSRSQADVDELDFGKLDMNESTDNYRTVRIEDSQWKGVMPSEASVYDFTKVSPEDCEDYEDYESGNYNEYDDWIKAHPECRTGRRSMDVFLKANQSANTPHDPWSLTDGYGEQYHEQGPQDDGLEANWVKVNPEIRSGRRSMDVFVKAESAKDTVQNTWSATSDEYSTSQLQGGVRGPAFPDQSPSGFARSEAPTASRFPDYSSSSSGRQRALSTSFPDY